MCKYLSFDIGGTAIKYAVIDKNDNIVESGSVDTQAHLGGERVVANVKALIEKYQPERIIIEWNGTILEKEYGLYCEVENDVNCAALAEFVSGSGKDSKKMLCLTIGTGIGGSFVSEGAVYHGANYSSCEVGYMRIDESGKNFQEICSTLTLCKTVAGKKKESVNKWNGHKML